MRIKFLKDCDYKQSDEKNSRYYKAGHEYDVTDDHGHRWLRRQVAVEVVKPEPPKAEPKAEAKPEPKSHKSDK